MNSKMGKWEKLKQKLKEQKQKQKPWPICVRSYIVQSATKRKEWRICKLGGENLTFKTTSPSIYLVILFLFHLYRGIVAFKAYQWLPWLSKRKHNTWLQKIPTSIYYNFKIIDLTLYTNTRCLYKLVGGGKIRTHVLSMSSRSELTNLNMHKYTVNKKKLKRLQHPGFQGDRSTKY